MSEARETDVILAGGGIVGLTIGLALAQAGLKVTIAEPMPESVQTDAKFDGRVSALSYASVRLFSALQVWPHLAPHAQPIHDILVTDGKLGGQAAPFSLHFDAAELGEKSLGHIVENRHIRLGLFAAAAGQKNLTLLSGTALADLAADPHGIEASLTKGEKIRGRLAVAADGRQSPMRDRMDIKL